MLLSQIFHQIHRQNPLVLLFLQASFQNQILNQVLAYHRILGHLSYLLQNPCCHQILCHQSLDHYLFCRQTFCHPSCDRLPFLYRQNHHPSCHCRNLFHRLCCLHHILCHQTHHPQTCSCHQAA